MRQRIFIALFTLLTTIHASAETSITDGLIGKFEPLGALDHQFVEVLSSPAFDTIDPAAAWRVENLTIELDGLIVTFTAGEFYPRMAVEGQVFGAVYMGEGRWQFKPPPG